MPRFKNSSYTAQNTKKKKRTSRLSRSASIRVHVEVRNGYGRARGVGAETKKTPDGIPEKKNELLLVVYICIQLAEMSFENI